MSTPLYFLCRLLPPRSDFMATMTAAERTVMQAHVAYWTGKVGSGEAVAFGPVADPAGGYGIGIIRVADRREVEALRDADPAMQSGLGFSYDILPMPQLVTAPPTG
jgi:uncharacterized protein YciI